MLIDVLKHSHTHTHSHTTAEPSTEIIGAPDLYIESGSTINLTCVIENSPEPPAYIFWNHNNAVSITIISHHFNHTYTRYLLYAACCSLHAHKMYLIQRNSFTEQNKERTRVERWQRWEGTGEYWRIKNEKLKIEYFFLFVRRINQIELEMLKLECWISMKIRLADISHQHYHIVKRSPSPPYSKLIFVLSLQPVFCCFCFTWSKSYWA